MTTENQNLTIAEKALAIIAVAQQEASDIVSAMHPERIEMMHDDMMRRAKENDTPRSFPGIYPSVDRVNYELSRYSLAMPFFGTLEDGDLSELDRAIIDTIQEGL